MRDHVALARYLAERERTAFAWGRRAHDCVAFAGGAVLAQTGRDPLEGLDWKDERSARRLLARLGGLAAAVSARLREVPPARAHRGDVAGVDDPELGLMLTIVEGQTLVAPGAGGLRHAPRSMMIRAWSAEIA